MVYTAKELGERMASIREGKFAGRISNNEYCKFYDSLTMYFDNAFIGEALRYSISITKKTISYE